MNAGETADAGKDEDDGGQQVLVQAFPCDETEQRHEDDIEAGDEAGLAGGGVGEAPLLAVHAEIQQDAADDTVACPVAPGGLAAQGEEEGKEGGGDGQTPSGEKRSGDDSGAVTLEDKGTAEKGGGGEQGAVATMERGTVDAGRGWSRTYWRPFSRG